MLNEGGKWRRQKRLSWPIGLKKSAELRGTSCYIARDGDLKGRLCRLSAIDCQKEVSDAWADQAHWTKMSILNAARMGRFSSDRTIREYGRDIWRVEPNPVELSDVD